MFNLNIPQDFEGLNVYNSMRSVAGRVQNDLNTAYYMRALYQRLLSGARFGLPESWSQGRRFFKNVVFQKGFIGIIKTDQYGIIPQIATPGGYGLFLQPTELFVNSMFVDNYVGKIGTDCEVIHLTNDWSGVWDIVEHYAIRLSTAITSVDVSLVNSRVSVLAAAKNKSASETLKYLYEKISAGEPFVVFDKAIKSEGLDGSEEPIWTYAQNVKDQYITDKLLDNVDTIIRQFDNEVGILAIGAKKERMITDEVESMNDDAVARASNWYDNLRESFDNVNRLFPELNLSFTLHYGGEDHEYIPEIDSNRSIR